MGPYSAAPDQGWLPFLKVLFGFLMLLVLAVLAAIMALGRIEATTSYGLNIILGGLLTLAGGFAQWAFAGGKPNEGEEEVNKTISQ